MGNITCVPQAPGALRSSFRRKPSLKKEQNGKKKLPSFLGLEKGKERETTTENILQYIPGKSIQSQENQKENLDQRFPSLFKKGRRKMVVRNMGKMIYYSKVKFKFQHCQEVNDCFLELFQSYLYFQSVGSNGLTYQGLLPLKELSVCEVPSGKSSGQEAHAFRIAGPLLNPLIIFCPTESDLKQWLYHLEKQIQLNGGSLGLPFLSQEWKQSSVGKEELRWSVQNMPVQEWRGTQRESLGDVLCVSKVKLQHLPFQEQHDRLLVLYPSTLVIVSEEHNGLCFKGELPLNAIQVLFEENEKTSFLIEGRLINSIRVICRSYEDYQEWLYCLKTAQFRNTDSSLSGSESFSASKPPHPSQFAGSGRGSLSSDGRTNSWASAGRVPAFTHLSHNSGSFPDGQSLLMMAESRQLEDPLSPGYSQPLHSLAQASWPSAGLPAQDLRRGGSARKSKPCAQQLPSQDSERSICSLIPESPSAELLSPVYSQPHPPAPHTHLDLGSLNRWSLVGSQPSTASSSLEKPPMTCSPLYADPYTPSSPSARSLAGSSFLEEFLQSHGQMGSAQTNGGSAPPHLSLQRRSCQPLPSSHCRELPAAPAYSSCRLQLRHPADAYLEEVSSLQEEHLGPSLHPADGDVDTYDLPEAGCSHLDSTAYHDYAELQSFQSDLSYDNLWEAEEKEPGTLHSSPASSQQFYQA
ncbi:pleckstrin homology domain-containing family N member 1 isoform X2 [Melanerpes formicivorus]|uniref:pleckstrin homology domain-containing family N member 1 isoform X2 n=1 Tax=Melanerpes formicivorus TaxID=211600 RepID=UPI00358F4D37